MGFGSAPRGAPTCTHRYGSQTSQGALRAAFSPATAIGRGARFQTQAIKHLGEPRPGKGLHAPAFQVLSLTSPSPGSYPSTLQWKHVLVHPSHCIPQTCRDGIRAVDGHRVLAHLLLACRQRTPEPHVVPLRRHHRLGTPLRSLHRIEPTGTAGTAKTDLHCPMGCATITSDSRSPRDFAQSQARPRRRERPGRSDSATGPPTVTASP